MNSKHPNLFIVGAAKAGTTSLYQYLSQHPAVYMCPIKEPNFFAKDIQLEKVRPEIKERFRLLEIDSFIKSDMKNSIHSALIQDEKQYNSLFRFVKDEKIIVEASTSYLYSTVAAQKIYEYNKDAKIIIILRNPIKRIYSHYLMDKKMAITKLDFEDAITIDRNNPSKSWGSKSLYYELGEYYHQVKRYYDIFPSKNIYLLLSEDLKNDAGAVVKDIFRFLEIESTFEPDLNQEFNVGVLPRNLLIGKMIANNYLRIKIRRSISNRSFKHFIKKILFKKPMEQSLSEETQRQLNSYYEEDIRKLAELIHKDLSHWQNKQVHTPNFLVVGAAKCGTTSLYNYLKQHPEVYMSPIKEPNHFSSDIQPAHFSAEYKVYEKNKNLDIEKYVNGPMNTEQWGAYVLNREHYLKLFKFVKKEKCIGEISNSYLYSQRAAENIYREFPGMKIIMILRQPAERAYSHYLANLRDGRTILPFREEVQHDDAKKEHGWSISHLYYELGLYTEQVTQFLQLFPAAQIKIFLFDDLKKDNRLLVKDLYEFLNLRTDISVQYDEKFNEARLPKHPALLKFITRLGIKRKIFRALPKAWQKKTKAAFFKEGKVPKMSEEDRKWMNDRYHDDIVSLEKLIKRDLKHWLQ